MSRLLLIGDIHFKTSNVTTTRVFTQKTLALAKKLKPDFIVILGDVLDTHALIHQGPFNDAVEFIKMLKEISVVYVLMGNHDLASNQCFLDERHAFNVLKDFEGINVVDKVTVLNTLQHDFVFVPYVPPGRFVEALNTVGEDVWKKASCIFAHQEFKGCKMSSISSSVGDEWNPELPMIFSGHIHDKQVVGGNVFYTGSSIQTASNESSNKVLWLLTFDTTLPQGWSYRQFNLNLPRKENIQIRLEDTDSLELQLDTVKYRLVLTGKRFQWESFCKSSRYKMWKNSGVIILFKPDAIDKPSDNTSVEFKNFDVILSEALRTVHPRVGEIYNEIISDKMDTS